MITCVFLLMVLCLLTIFTIAMGIFKLLWYSTIPILTVVIVIAVIISLFKT